MLAAELTLPRDEFLVVMCHDGRIGRWLVINFVIGGRRPTKCADSALQSACDSSAVRALVGDQEFSTNARSR